MALDGDGRGFHWGRSVVLGGNGGCTGGRYVALDGDGRI